MGERRRQGTDFNDEHRWQVCDYCNIELELDAGELSRGWYTCPECGQMSHLADTGYETASPVFQFPGSDGKVKWVRVAEMAGAEEAALEVSYLRANGIEAFAWNKGGGQAFDLTGSGMGAFYVVVPKDQEQNALSIRGNLAECTHCRESLAISDLEATQEWFVCPVCLGTCYLSDTVTCLSCSSQSHLEEAGREQGWYRCPGCDRLIPMKVLNNRVECGCCDSNLELSNREMIQGWFFCPVCHEMGYLGGPVTCLSCGQRQDLDKAEWQQGWYRCLECKQTIHLIESFTEIAEPAPESPDQMPDDDWIEPGVEWVKVKQVTSAEETVKLVSFLQANGVEAFTLRGKGKGAFGLAIDTLNIFSVMVQVNQKQQARELLEAEEVE